MPDQTAGRLSPLLRGQRFRAVRRFLKGRVLDVGCGTGGLADLVPPPDYLGTDTDSDSIELARTAHPGHRFEPTADGSKFDTVAALATIEHVPDPAGFLTYLHQQLAPGGRIVLTTPDPRLGWAHRLGAQLGLLSREAAGEHKELLDQEALERYAAAAGLRVAVYERFLGGANQLAVLVPAEASSVIPQASGIEAWLARNQTAIALGIIALGLLLRILAALPNYFDPDELYHIQIAGDTTIADVFRRLIEFRIPHPPLYYMLVYLLNLFAKSEFLFRLPSVLAGTGLLWVAYCWLRRLLDSTAALVGLILLAFAPEMIALSAQVREYALAMLLMTGALYYLERALADRSAVKMAVAGGLLAAAQATLYAAMWLAAGLGVYGLVRLVREKPGRRVAASWLWAQLALLALLAVLYATQISRLVGWKQNTAVEGWLRSSYFHAGSDSILFPLRQSLYLFQYLYSTRAFGFLLLGLFLVGVLVTARRWKNTSGPATLLHRGRSPESGFRSSDLRSRVSAWLVLVLPFLVNIVAAFGKFYPYGGSRHLGYLAPLAAAGIGAALASLAGGRRLPVLLASAVLVPLWLWKFTPPGQYIAPASQRRSVMTEVTRHIRRLSGENRMVFTDFQTQMMLRYYLAGVRHLDGDAVRGDFRERDADGIAIVYPDIKSIYWSFDYHSFGPQFSRMVEEYGLAPGTRVCAAQGGWGWTLGKSLPWDLNIEYPETRTCGDNFSVFVVPVGLEPGNPPTHEALRALAAAVPAGDVKTVFWPTDHLPTDSSRRAAVLSYKDFYREAGSLGQKLAARVPSLAFWQFGNLESHNPMLRQMDARENYMLAGFAFTLLAESPDRRAGVYRIHSRSAAVLDSLLELAEANIPSPVKTVVWPTALLTPGVRERAGRLGTSVQSYAEFSRRLSAGADIRRFLPALAFWEFGTSERHTEGLAYMNDAENYIYGGCRFTFVAVDALRTAGVYLIEPLQP